MVRDRLKGVSSGFDSAVRNAGGSTRQGGDLQQLKDAIPKHPANRIQANIPFEAWEEIYNAGMKAGMEGVKLSGAGGSPGQPYTPPTGPKPNEPYVPAPGRQKLAHNVPDHSKGHYDEYGRPTSDPTKGINPGGGPVDLPHMEVPSEERQRREGDHMRKYHT